jgi:hypothetical protein
MRSLTGVCALVVARAKTPAARPVVESGSLAKVGRRPRIGAHPAVAR